jgi:hypothetical protein
MSVISLFSGCGGLDFGIEEAGWETALQEGRKFRFPQPTHGDTVNGTPDMIDTQCEPYATSWDAIGEIRPDENEKLAVGGKWGGQTLASSGNRQRKVVSKERRAMPRTRYFLGIVMIYKTNRGWNTSCQVSSAK